MSILMTLRVAADPGAVEAIDGEVLDTIVERAKSLGVISHHFYGNEAEILVVDEWPDEQSFRHFFETTPEIKDVMHRAGVETEPSIDIWRHLDVDDDVG